jgi:hypothetical protein
MTDPAAELVGEPIGNEPFDELKVLRRVKKLRAEMLKSSHYKEYSSSSN